MEIIVEQKNNNQDLPGDKRSRIVSKLGSTIFLIEQAQLPKNEMLKQPIHYRSYRAVNIHKAEISTGKGNVKGLLINGHAENEMFLHAKNTKFTNEAAEKQKEGGNDGGNNNQNQDKSYLIATDEKSAREYVIDFNVLQREKISGMIQALENSRSLIQEIIEADRDSN